MERRAVRVLIVDDHASWRLFVRSVLEKQPGFQIIGEASDGAEAVQKSQELQPDLMLLDVGLPTLNGLEASRRILQSCPKTKILFVSEQRSADIAEGALHSGASGYVLKSDATGELLPAVEAVLQGRRFLSARLAGRNSSAPGNDEPAKINHCHEVAFFTDDHSVVDSYAGFVESALGDGDIVVLVATETHRADVLHRLQSDGVDVAGAIERGNYIPLDAVNTLSKMMVNDRPDPGRCAEVVGDLIVAASSRIEGSQTRVKFCGEIAPTLMSRGNAEGAIEIERVWDQITRKHGAGTLCGYLWNSLPGRENNPLFQRICAEHTAVRRG